MSHRFTRARKSAGFWPYLLGGAVVFFPLSLTQVDFRSAFTTGLSVAMHKSSPAYAAFEDLHEVYPDDGAVGPADGELLAAGVKFDSRALPRLAMQRRIASQGLTIRMPARTEPKPFYVAGETLRREAVRPMTFSPSPARAIAPEDEDVGTPSVSSRAAELVEREINKSVYSSGRTIQTSTGTPVYIARGTPVPAATEPAGRDTGADATAGFSTSSFLPIRPPDDSQGPLWLKGQIEMTGGLAFMGPETRLVVKRVFNGETLEKGRIWVTEGRFEIHVKTATGYLVAELATKEGQILGRGELDLVDLRNARSDGRQIGDLRIALRPATDTASMRAISGYSHDHQMIPVRQAGVEIQSYMDRQPVNEDGFVNEPSLSADSTFVARASADKHWSSLVIGQVGHPQDIRLLSDSMVDALIGLDLRRSERDEAESHAIIWGQISEDGEPVAGAQVQMAQGGQAIYFNEMYLPDPHMTATGKNGLFAFLNVPAGVQAMRVKSRGRIYPAQVFPTEDKHVSYLELELRDRIVSRFKVVDVLDMTKPVPASLRLVGVDGVVDSSGDDYIEYAAASNTVMVEADAGPEYEISRATLTGAPHMVHVPVVRRNWLAALAGESGTVAAPNRGAVVGFVDGRDFEVEITGLGPYERAQVVYFDAQGKMVSGATGVAGGGFAIFNAPPGLQTVYIHPLGGRRTFSQVVVAEPSYVHVLTWTAPAAP